MTEPTDLNELASPESERADQHPQGRDADSRGRSWMQRLDTLCEHTAQLAFVWMWPVVYGLFLGSSAWWVAHPEAIEALGNNRISIEQRHSALAWAAGGVLLVLVGYASAHIGAQLWSAEKNGRALTRALNWWGLPVLSLPLLVAVARPLFERRHPQMAVFFPLLIGITWGVFVYRLRLPAWSKAPKLLASNAFRRTLTMLVLATGYVAYGVFFSRLAIINHHSLHTATFDLGLYDNIFYQSLHGTPLGCSFLKNNYHGAAHFDPILVLLSPLYAFYPRAESILVLQSFWMAAGVFPLYLLVKRQLQSRALALGLSSTWLLYAPLQGANMYDFHSLSLIAPLVVTLYYFLEMKSLWGFWVTLVALLLVREDVPLLLCFIAAAGITSGTRFAVRQGWLSIIISLVYFVLAKGVFMGAPEDALEGTQTYTFAFYYSDLIPNDAGLGELIQSLLTNPTYVVQMMLVEDKAQFLLLVFAPLGFLPLLAGKSRLAMVYGLVFCLLATREAVYSIYFQYVCLLCSVAFPLAGEGLQRLTGFAQRTWGLRAARFRRAAISAVWLTSALVCFKWGGIVENVAFRGGFAAPDRELDARERSRYAWVRSMVEQIPQDASVGSTRRMGPHISNRARAYGYDFRTPHDFLFLDEAQIEKKWHSRHQAFLKRHEYESLGRSGKMVLYKRKTP